MYVCVGLLSLLYLSVSKYGPNLQANDNVKEGTKQQFARMVFKSRKEIVRSPA